MNSVRILVIGGLTTYRALFNWVSPWILVPSLLVMPLAQILLFSYIGRSAGIESDTFFVVGNAVQYSALPCLLGTASTVVGERLQRTLGIVLASPAPRLALVIGRTLPVMLNGLAVSVFGLVAGSVLLGLPVRAATLGPTTLTIAVSVFGCTGLGLVSAAVGLRLRDSAVLSTILFGILLLCSGADIPRPALPGWLAAAGDWLPLAHGIAAARSVAAGGGIGGVAGDLAAEALLGLGYGMAGVLMLRLLERRSRSAGALDLT